MGVLVTLIQALLPPEGTVDSQDIVEAHHDTEHCPSVEDSTAAAWAGPVITRRVLELAKKLGIPPEALL